MTDGLEADPTLFTTAGGVLTLTVGRKNQNPPITATTIRPTAIVNFLSIVIFLIYLGILSRPLEL